MWRDSFEELTIDTENSEEGIFSGYASVFNEIDSYGDIVLPGTFRRSLELSTKDRVKLLWQHNPKEPIGFLKIMETTVGLFVEGKILLQLQRGMEAYRLIKSGVVDGLSIGYEVNEYFYDDDIRYIKQATLWEVSIVTFPALIEARINNIRVSDAYKPKKYLQRYDMREQLVK